MLLDAEFDCAYCGEANETSVDPSAGRVQQYVEDCQVCCRPNVLFIEISREGGRWEAVVNAEPESEGS